MKLELDRLEHELWQLLVQSGQLVFPPDAMKVLAARRLSLAVHWLLYSATRPAFEFKRMSTHDPSEKAFSAWLLQNLRENVGLLLASEQGLLDESGTLVPAFWQ